ncbi:hypothetical protein COOONC_03725 [Cooperia oncophora]
MLHTNVLFFTVLLLSMSPTTLADSYRNVPDPYRWMEDPDAEETRHFVDQLNAISESFLAKAPSRDKIRKRVLYQQKNLTEKGEVFLDPNTLSPDGTIALA